MEEEKLQITAFSHKEDWVKSAINGEHFRFSGVIYHDVFYVKVDLYWKERGSDHVVEYVFDNLEQTQMFMHLFMLQFEDFEKRILSFDTEYPKSLVEEAWSNWLKDVSWV